MTLPRTRVGPAGLLLLSTLLFARPVLAEDDFLGRDKFYHAMGSMVLAQTGYAVTMRLQDGDGSALPLTVGFAAAMVPGIAKEIWDFTRPDSTCSAKDLAWDAIGTTVGLVIAQGLYLLFGD